MQFGHFDDRAKEYVITRPNTPRPWSNYLGSLDYGAIITNNAGGYSFYKSALSSRFLRLRSNSVPMDQPGRYFYLRDQVTGDFWSSSWQPVGKPLSKYKSTCRHGTAYTIITSRYSAIETESTYFVPLGQAFEYWRLKVTNKSKQPRTLALFTYCEMASPWHMPNDLTNLQYSQFITKATVDQEMLGMAVHPYHAFDPQNLMGCHRLWMTLVGAPLIGYETVRERFLGSVYHTYANPQAVIEGRCSNFLAEGENAIGTLQTEITLQPGETRELIAMLGLGTPESHGYAARAEFGTPERCEAELQKLKQHWHSLLGAVKVKTPDAEFDAMANTWGAYNALITYTWSRHASLIYNGERDGLGFRDTVQDFLGAMPMLREQIRERLELMLTGQVSNGGAMPVVAPFSHQPGTMPPPKREEYRSDDCQWFFNAIPDYVAETGDLDFYRKVLPYADQGEATVLGHLRRALEFNLERSGKNGLPCGLHADWNDCVKMGYNGESVMVAEQLRFGLATYATIAEKLHAVYCPGDATPSSRPPDHGEDAAAPAPSSYLAEAAWARTELTRLEAAIQKAAWDGEWFLWAIGEDGYRYGSKTESEGKIYINTQVWAVMSGAATPEQGRKCMDALKRDLATPYGIMLSAPPFTHTPPTVMGGVIYNHGIKENAGIFCHTQSWAVIAEAMLGNGDQAYDYYRAFMPAAYNTRAELREIEPYVHCQTTYATCNRNAGKSRVPWLSGTASWSHHTALQWILGVRPELDGLRIDPCIPRSWPGFTMTRVFRGKTIRIEVKNPNGVSKGVGSLVINGKKIDGNLAPLDRLTDGTKVVATLG
ncbi:GH36-type glycosyl hydrolase domain-containing protein [Opitutus terrae]|uniref:Glycosyltransferase 36 n=1 Tax=Opitutus terrae (strain DSM 11246 / JCM 15787 / PB90-1) TaxID=452637 RepID=B1ZVU2_OPITP|nr:glycosyl hydrolase family 65 protein [Opitutus terrae]ACB75028.1 glycosyltransferase 36 [Opitutus terrae PB90-1]